MFGPDKNKVFPLEGYNRLCFLKNIIKNPNIIVGDGAIVATNATVVRNVEPYSIVGGNPAIVIRKRFPDEKIQQLLELKWWNWEPERITEHIQELAGNDPDHLLNKIQLEKHIAST